MTTIMMVVDDNYDGCGDDDYDYDDQETSIKNGIKFCRKGSSDFIQKKNQDPSYHCCTREIITAVGGVFLKTKTGMSL